ncbi:MAG: S-layer homology domain-containing protein [Candidatus Gracilibacteria bacterium]|jgi:flagellar hook assembly protein FlgD
MDIKKYIQAHRTMTMVVGGILATVVTASAVYFSSGGLFSGNLSGLNINARPQVNFAPGVSEPSLSSPTLDLENPKITFTYGFKKDVTPTVDISVIDKNSGAVLMTWGLTPPNDNSYNSISWDGKVGKAAIPGNSYFFRTSYSLAGKMQIVESNPFQAVAPLNVKPVVQIPLSATCTPSAITGVVGDTITYTATIKGGVPPYKTRWSESKADFLKNGSLADNAGTNAYKITYSNVGEKTTMVTQVIDNENNTINDITCTPAVTINLAPANAQAGQPNAQNANLALQNNPLANNAQAGQPDAVPPVQLKDVCSASPLNGNVGDTITYTANISGGTPPYTTQWSNSDTPKVTFWGNTYKIEYKIAGPKTVTLTITDKAGATLSDPKCPGVTINENQAVNQIAPSPIQKIGVPTKIVVQCAATPSPANVGDTVTWKVTGNVPAGSGYLWDGNIMPPINQPTATAVYQNTSPKNVSVKITAPNKGYQDSDVTNCTTLTVNDSGKPALSNFTLSASSYTLGDPNKYITFGGTLSGAGAPNASNTNLVFSILDSNNIKVLNWTSINQSNGPVNGLWNGLHLDNSPVTPGQYFFTAQAVKGILSSPIIKSDPFMVNPAAPAAQKIDLGKVGLVQNGQPAASKDFLVSCSTNASSSTKVGDSVTWTVKPSFGLLPSGMTYKWGGGYGNATSASLSQGPSLVTSYSTAGAVAPVTVALTASGYNPRTFTCTPTITIAAAQPSAQKVVGLPGKLGSGSGSDLGSGSGSGSDLGSGSGSGSDLGSVSGSGSGCVGTTCSTTGNTIIPKEEPVAIVDQPVDNSDNTPVEDNTPASDIIETPVDNTPASDLPENPPIDNPQPPAPASAQIPGCAGYYDDELTLGSALCKLYDAALEYAKTYNFMTGNADGNFGPHDNLQRDQIAKIALEIGNKFVVGTDYCNGVPSFPDVPLSAWSSQYLCYAKQFGIVTGYGDGLYRPSNPVTNSEFVAIMSRMLKVNYGILIPLDASKNYLDVSTSDWYARYSAFFFKWGLIVGDYLYPEKPTIRIDVVQVIYMMHILFGKF